MPELPEVETIARKLQLVLPGREIQSIEQLHPKTLHGTPEYLLGQTIKQVTRRAKIIIIHFDNNFSMIIHLKMTGQLIYLDKKIRVGGGHPTTDWVNQLPSKHTRTVIHFTDDSTLFFNDQRLFGWLKIMPTAELSVVFTLLAPDVIDEQVTPEYLASKLQKRSSTIKQLIMDNTIMAGLGNIYACDALNVARIHPQRPAKTLTLAEVTTLLAASKVVLQQGIELGGTTFDGKYVDIEGMAGQYQSVVRVYGREGMPCLNCGTPIKKIKVEGRGTYFCPQCQL